MGAPSIDRLAALGSCLLACCLGCGAPPTVSLDLTEIFALAESLAETESVDFGTPEARVHLLEGWGADLTTRAGRPFVLAATGRSVLRLVVGEPRDLSLRFRIWPARSVGSEAVLIVQVGGAEVGRTALAPRARWYQLTLPGSLLHPGENAIELISSEAPATPGEPPPTPLGVAWDLLEIENARSFGLPRVERDGAEPVLRLPLQAVLSYYVMLPQGGELRVVSLAPWRASGAGPDLRLEVEVLAAGSERGETSVARARSSGSGASFRLPPVAEGPVRISLRAAAGGAPPEEPAGLDLVRPELWTPQSLAATPMPAASGLPNVIVYMIDTLRADRLGIYGHEVPTSPQIDAFARDATIFDGALAQSAWTRPAVASVFSGLNPPSHGVVRPNSALPPDLPLLAELLQQAGYVTHGIVTNGNVAPAFGFARGFHTYRYMAEAGLPEMHVFSDRVNSLVFHWLEQRPNQRPFFLYLHTTDPHGPYTPRAPYRQRFAGWVADPEVGGVPLFRRLQQGEWPYPDIAGQLAALYDAEVAFNDASFGALLDELRRHGLYDSTLVILLSDHGEAFAEHGSWQHGNTLYTELLSIPLVMRFPDGRGRGQRVTQRARQVDVLPTLLDYLGIAIPSGVQGRSLLPALDGGDGSPLPVPSFAHLARNRGEWESVVQGSQKLIRTRTRDGGQEKVRLFDLAADPHERTNVAARRPVWRGYLLSQLERLGAAEEAPAADIDPELRERLEALGYL